MATLDVVAFKRQQRKMFSKGADKGPPSPPLLGLPVKRVVPMDVHSMLDYAGGTTLLATALLAKDACAATAGAVLGAAATGVSLFTDYRMSLKKLIPIEVHEVADYVYGFGSILAPFIFGYAKKAKWVAAVQIAVGVSSVIGSLFTDYRSQTGVHWKKSPTLPRPVGA